MTAIKEFERLESLGLWRDLKDSQRREVVVSFGESTLVLSDINNRPITHWSLAAIEDAGNSENGIIFTVDDLGEETLEIDDQIMISAIYKIKASIEARRPHPGRLRLFLGASILISFLGVSIFWLPNALTQYASNIVPDSKAVEIGEVILKSIQKTTGSTCSTPLGERALRRLENRVIGSPSNRIQIIEMGNRPSLHLPGGNILLNYRLTLNEPNANLIAGYAILERAIEDEKSPLFDLFKSMGLKKTLKFLGTGDIDNSDLEYFANKQLFGALSAPKADTISELFNVAEIPRMRFANHANRSDLLIANDLMAEEYLPILDEVDWLNLQEICEN
ncbi:hypothetical protein N8305_00845 [bacterium]|nr:hypothetical protein [bacterium]